jgi:hypothetical protein
MLCCAPHVSLLRCSTASGRSLPSDIGITLQQMSRFGTSLSVEDIEKVEDIE